jgi:hypothetical protein
MSASSGDLIGMSQASGTQAGGKAGGKKVLWLASIALVVVALGAGLFGYVGMTPHTVTLTSTSTSYATNTSVITSTSTVASVSTNTFTSVITTTASAPPGNIYAIQNCSPSNCQQPCYFNGCQGYCYSNDCDFNVCQSVGTDSTQCSGYLYQDENGCVELVIPIGSPVAQPSYQFYTLQGLPSSLPPFGSWVTVTGQVYRGSNTSSNGAACPGNYIVVSSIS